MRDLKPCGELQGEVANRNWSVETNRSQILMSYYLLEKGRSSSKRILNGSWLSRRFARHGGKLGNLGFFLDLRISYITVKVIT